MELNYLSVAPGPTAWVVIVLALVGAAYFAVFAAMFAINPRKAIAWSYPGRSGRLLLAQQTRRRVERQRRTSPILYGFYGLGLLALGLTTMLRYLSA